ncbi:MAG: twin-arginine translocation signal domain-containing protein [Planctomycetota bacterium]
MSDSARPEQKKSILPLSGIEKHPKKQAVKTTIVGAQPPRNERPMQNIPVGIEQLLAMAAVDNEFAAALMNDHESAIAASEVELTETEKGILSSIPAPALKQMIGNVRGRIPLKERRTFLKKSAAALLALVSGGTALLAPQETRASRGSRPDKPKSKRNIPAWTSIYDDITLEDGEIRDANVFEIFPGTSACRMVKPFMIYFYRPGENENEKDIKKSISFEADLAKCATFEKASAGFGKFLCDTSTINEKVLKKFGLSVPQILIFNALGRKVHILKSIPANAEKLSEKLEEIKKESDEAIRDKQEE